MDSFFCTLITCIVSNFKSFRFIFSDNDIALDRSNNQDTIGSGGLYPNHKKLKNDTLSAA